VKRIMKAFPNAIGVRTHMWGFVDVLYSTKKDAEEGLKCAEHERGLPRSIGNFFYDLKVEKFADDRFEELGKFPDGMSEGDLVGNVSIFYRFDRQTSKIEKFPVLRK